MDHAHHPPPRHYEMDPYPPPRHGSMGGNMGPPNVHMGGGSTHHAMPGRKTLLNTPNLPPPHQDRPPGGHPPHYRDGPPQSHPPHHPEQHYRSQPADHFSGLSHGDRGRDPYYTSRDSYGAGEGQPRSSSGYPPPSELFNISLYIDSIV